MTNQKIMDRKYDIFLTFWKLNEYYETFSWCVLKSWRFATGLCFWSFYGKESINSFELDPAHYLSTPGYNWDAKLRFSDVNLKPSLHNESVNLLKTPLRGCISIICKGYAKAKNKFLKSYDVKKPTLFAIYLDTINLCGYSMMQIFRTEILDWHNPKHLI